MKTKLVLTGAYAGRTMVINGHKFEKGELPLSGELDKLGNLIRYFSFFNAYLAGSEELAAAQERDAKWKEEGHGFDEVLDGEGSGAGGASTDGSETAGSASGAGNAGTEADGAGAVSEGNGVSEGRVANEAPVSSDPQVLKVVDALKALDPENEEFWTDAGLPKVAAIEDASGVVGVTRKDIEAAWPGFNRDKAMEMLVNSL